MDINHILIWTICLSCTTILLRNSRISKSFNSGWNVVAIFILTATILSLYIVPNVAGLIGGSLWIILLVIPLIGFRKVNQLASQELYSQARKLATYICWLHPADGWLEQPQLLKALEIGQQGDITQAIEILNRYQNNKTSLGRSSTILLYRMTARWSELLTWMRDTLPDQILFQESNLVGYYLRALGETGDLNTLLQELQRCQPNLEKIGDLPTLNLARMFALAFCGQPEEVQKLFNSTLGNYSPNTRKFWLATAEMAAGNESIAQQQLLDLRSNNNSLNEAIAWRLSHPHIAAEESLTESSKEILSRLKAELNQEARYGSKAFLSKKAYATYGLIGLNLLVFALEINSGGSEDATTLYKLGALVPQAVWAGEWWRLINATFLHFGWLHLSMNMLGLYFLGAFVEFSLGIWRYLICYFASGIGSMLFISYLAKIMNSPLQITVGASGAIMGLIGVMGAIMLWGWYHEKSSIAAKRLRSILFIVGLQTVFDLTTPQVSFVGHLSGAVIGFGIGLLLIQNRLSSN